MLLWERKTSIKEKKNTQVSIAHDFLSKIFVKRQRRAGESSCRAVENGCTKLNVERMKPRERYRVCVDRLATSVVFSFISRRPANIV